MLDSCAGVIKGNLCKVKSCYCLQLWIHNVVVVVVVNVISPFSIMNSFIYLFQKLMPMFQNIVSVTVRKFYLPWSPNLTNTFALAHRWQFLPTLKGHRDIFNYHPKRVGHTQIVGWICFSHLTIINYRVGKSACNMKQLQHMELAHLLARPPARPLARAHTHPRAHTHTHTHTHNFQGIVPKYCACPEMLQICHISPVMCYIKHLRW
jgi:hypothetical protein